MALAALAVYWVAAAARQRHRGGPGLATVNFLTSLAVSFAIEIGQLLVCHKCCGCCPCIDDDAILEDDEQGVEMRVDAAAARAGDTSGDAPPALPPALA